MATKCLQQIPQPKQGREFSSLHLPDSCECQNQVQFSCLVKTYKQILQLYFKMKSPIIK